MHYLLHMGLAYKYINELLLPIEVQHIKVFEVQSNYYVLSPAVVRSCKSLAQAIF